MTKLLLKILLSVLILVAPDFPVLFVWHLHMSTFRGGCIYLLRFLPMESRCLWTSGTVDRQKHTWKDICQYFRFLWLLLLLQKFNFFKTVNFKHFFPVMMCLLAPFVVNFIDFEPLFFSATTEYKCSFLPSMYNFVINGYKIASALWKGCFRWYIEHTVITQPSTNFSFTLYIEIYTHTHTQKYTYINTWGISENLNY